MQVNYLSLSLCFLDPDRLSAHIGANPHIRPISSDCLRACRSVLLGFILQIEKKHYEILVNKLLKTTCHLRKTEVTDLDYCTSSEGSETEADRRLD
ncbi:hypothetical protein ILYODFUR_016088 [Ilyodon furcidens]|uniref:Uncharacterized protein n=1 Tax=Ilyodon furcidens TaxID=33524 RepID=A0ABV0SQ07_9TELE